MAKSKKSQVKVTVKKDLSAGPTVVSVKGLTLDGVKSVQSQLGTIGFQVDSAESGKVPVFGRTSVAQLTAFQSRFNLPQTGVADTATTATLALAALAATEGNRATLQSTLRASLNKVPTSPAYNYWLARSALVARDYVTAQSAVKGAVNYSDATLMMGPILKSPGVPQSPDGPYPENFYSYRYSPFASSDLDQLQAQLANLAAPANIGVPWAEAMRRWQLGNQAFARQESGEAVAAYDACQQAALDYFRIAYNINPPGTVLNDRLTSLLTTMRKPATASSPDFSLVWNSFQWRRNLLSLSELQANDWARLKNLPMQGSSFVTTFLLPAGKNQFQHSYLEVALLTVACVLVPLARSESNRMRRFFDGAIRDLIWVMNPFTSLTTPRNAVSGLLVATLDPAVRPLNATTVTSPTASIPPVWPLSQQLTCDFIEVPFAKLQYAETLLDKADAEYKSQTQADPVAFPQSAQYQNLQAAQTYLAVPQLFASEGNYTIRAQAAADAIRTNVEAGLAASDGGRSFRVVGLTTTLPTLISTTNRLPGLNAKQAPHASLVSFQPPAGQTIMRETNPRVYSALLTAQAKLVQIAAGLNYLGYSDDYIPPWRFSFLLDRARYFTEHAKNAQRDYLNFLNNAENEANKETSAEQTVELETSNVQIETARVEQATQEVSAVRRSADLAKLNATDAQTRLHNFQDFDTYMSELNSTSWLSAAVSIGVGIAEVATGAGAAAGISSISQGLNTAAGATKDELQRNLEESNLKLTVGEAQAAAQVAQAQLAAAKSGLSVASLERQAALLRHEFALQNLQLMQNQTLNAEQWYRLANAIRGVSDTYLRYAIQLSFLAQQAYEFESDRRMNVIRFDYDLSDVGSMLAADFLGRDLDTIEADLLVSQETRQQEVRYVVSLARDFPAAMSDLADSGEVSFSLRLEQLERHFPGLYNLRITSVDVLPVALMDPTRVTLQLTQIGSGQVRLKAQPDTLPGVVSTSPLNATDGTAPDDGWLSDSRDVWPVKAQISGPQTSVFSGLSQAAANSLNFINAQERGAFEGLPAASAWQIDLSSGENQIVPGTLSDVVITFTLAGFFDADLRAAVNSAPTSARAVTKFLSAQRSFPDSYYSLIQTGRLSWKVNDNMLVLNGAPGALRNLGVGLTLPDTGPELGRSYCRYMFSLLVSTSGASVVSTLPQFAFSTTQLSLTCVYSGPTNLNSLTYNFGDGTALVTGTLAGAGWKSVTHTYARPGRYVITTRLVDASGRLTDYRASVVVSTLNLVAAPLAICPQISSGPAVAGKIPVTIALPGGLAGMSLVCVATGGEGISVAGNTTISLLPRTAPYQFEFIATRDLDCRIYGQQRSLAAPLKLSARRVSTNQVFDLNGNNVTTAPNSIAQQLFAGGTAVLSPEDTWTLELPTASNPWFTTVSASDVPSFDGSELGDAVLVLEYMNI